VLNFFKLWVIRGWLVDNLAKAVEYRG